MAPLRNTSASFRRSPTISPPPGPWATSMAGPARRRQAVGQYTRIGDHWLREGMPGESGRHLQESPQARSPSRVGAAAAGRGLRTAGPAGRSQGTPPQRDREAAEPQRPVGRRLARHPPERARPQRLRGPARGVVHPRADRQGHGRRPARSLPRARCPRADGGSRGAARGGRSPRSRRHRGAAAPRRAPRSPATSSIARASSCPTPTGSTDQTLLLTAGEVLLKLGRARRRARAAGALPLAQSRGRRGRGRARRPAAAARTLRHGRSAGRSGVQQPATTARPRAASRRSSIARRDTCRRCCGWSKSASTATSTRR